MSGLGDARARSPIDRGRVGWSPDPTQQGSGLAAWGWTDEHAAAFASHLASTGERSADEHSPDAPPVAPGSFEPGRVVVEERGTYLVRIATGEISATPSGRFRWDAELEGASGYPAVGDWLVLSPTGSPEHRIVQAVLPRRTAVVRRAPTDHGVPEQILAANVDLLLLVSSLNRDLNPRRLERYLAVAWSSGAEPVIVLNKADLADDVDAALSRVEPIASGVPVHVVSALTGVGLAELARRLRPGRTVALVGSSGVGKSSLVNALAGETVEETRGIRDDDARGRHTTTRRHLALLPGGGLVLDTPGLRELGLTDAADGLDQAFADIGDLSADCRFGDCRHDGEPGCAVQAAIADGRLDGGRLASQRKLERELARAERQRNPTARADERRKWRLINSSVRHHMRYKYGDESW